MRRRYCIGTLAVFFILAMAVCSHAAQETACKVTKALYYGCAARVDLSVPDIAEGVVLQVSQDKSFRDKSKIVTVSTRGVKVTDSILGGPDNSLVRRAVLEKRGVRENAWMTYGPISACGNNPAPMIDRMDLAGYWEKKGNLVSACMVSAYDALDNTTRFSFLIEGSAAYSRNVPVYVRAKTGYCDQWNRYCKAKKCAYSEKALRFDKDQYSKEASRLRVSNLKSGALHLKEGEKKKLKVCVPEYLTGCVTFTSKDKTVATVNRKGIVKAVGEGKTKVFVRYGARKTVVPVVVRR